MHIVETLSDPNVKDVILKILRGMMFKKLKELVQVFQSESFSLRET
jgi:hypothetical protein